MDEGKLRNACEEALEAMLFSVTPRGGCDDREIWLSAIHRLREALGDRRELPFLLKQALAQFERRIVREVEHA